MKEKFQKFLKKLLKCLLTLLVIALVCFCTYMVYVHRNVIRAAIKGEPMPEATKGHCCHRKKK